MTTPVYYTGSILSTQDLFSISEPFPSQYGYNISNVSKATTAVVTTSTTTTVSTTGTIGSIAGTGPYTAVITGMSSTAGLLTGQQITATAGTGNLGVGTTTVTSIIGNKSIGITSSATQNAGTITNIKLAAPNLQPVDFVDGAPILINGVSGMTQLATAGENGTNLFYANVVNSTSFELYSDSALTANVNSSSFTNAVANTGSYEIFNVTQYNSVPSPQNVVFNHSLSSNGSLITLDTATGIITLTDVNDFSLSAVVNTTRSLPPTSNAGCQWFNMTSDEYIGSFTKFGQPCTAIINVSATTEVVLRVFSDTGTFEYPNQLFDASFQVQLSVPV